MYKSLTDVPAPIKEFYFEEVVSEPTGEMIEQTYLVDEYDETTGEPTGSQVERTRQVPEMADVTYVREHVRPETKSLADLERVLDLGKPLSVVTKFANMVALESKWNYLDIYKGWKETNDELVELNLELPKLDEDGELLQAAYPLADEPIKPVVRSIEEVLADTNGMSGYNKEIGTKINGVNVSLTEKNQNGIAAVMKGIELAAKYNKSLLPIKFTARTMSGIAKIEFSSVEDFELFALEFIAKRQEFFK